MKNENLFLYDTNFECILMIVALKNSELHHSFVFATVIQVSHLLSNNYIFTHQIIKLKSTSSYFLFYPQDIFFMFLKNEENNLLLKVIDPLAPNEEEDFKFASLHCWSVILFFLKSLSI